VVYQTALIQMTLSYLEGHFSPSKRFYHPQLKNIGPINLVKASVENVHLRYKCKLANILHHSLVWASSMTVCCSPC